MSLARIALTVAGGSGLTAFAFWALAQLRVHLVRIHTELDIKASKEATWAALSDFERYRSWNPLMIEVRRPRRAVTVGERMEWTSRINEATRDYNARIDRVFPNREISWTGPISSLRKILFWGEHRMIIEELSDDRVRLINKERFGGVMTIPLAGYLKRDVRAAYDAANEALSRRVGSTPN